MGDMNNGDRSIFASGAAAVGEASPLIRENGNKRFERTL